MKSILRPTLMIAIVFAISSISTRAQAVIEGTLLRSNGKPFSYAELEIVPPELKRIIIDSRFVSTSDSRGRFIFNNVPPGRYTLSINFDDKPSELVPYDTYFYPIAFDRIDAEVLNIESSTRLRNIVFRLPPALTAKTINGTVVWENGAPVKDASIGLWDLRIESSAMGTGHNADANGRFKIVGFVGRKYQLGALAFDRPLNQVLGPRPHVIGVGETPPFVINDSTNEMTIVVRPPQRPDDDYWKRYIGQVPGQHQFFEDACATDSIFGLVADTNTASMPASLL